MNTPLPQQTFARRFSAFAAAVLVTVATLATIDRLASPDRAAPLLARMHASAAV